MRSKVTVVLLFLNVVLFAYIYYYDKPMIDARKNLEARRRVLGPEVAAIDSLTRTSRTGPTVKLEKHGDSWWLATPYEWPANGNAVASIINELQFLEHETSFAVAELAQSGRKLADYGLEEPALTLQFTSGKKDYTLKIGDTTEIGNRLYVLSTDGQRIHVVSRSLAESLGRPLADLRSDSIFTVPVFEVRSLNVQTAAPSNLKVRLRRDAAARWAYEAPIIARASKTAVEVTINTLNALTARSFLEPRDTDLERIGLNASPLQVTLEGNARRETLLLGNATGATVPREGASGPDVEYFAKIEDKTVAFTTAVPADLLRKLRAAQEELRDPRVLDFDPATVTAFSIIAPDQPELTLQKLEGEQGWQSVVRSSGQAPQTSAADPGLVTGLLQKLAVLSAQEIRQDQPKFLSDAPSASDLENWGFNRPEREITLNLNTGGGPLGKEPSILTLQVGASPDKPGEAYARVKGSPFVYRILPDIIEETPAAPLHYRLRLLRELPESARLTALRLTELSPPREVFSATNEAALTPQSFAAVKMSDNARTALVALLLQLRTLRVKAYLPGAFNPDHVDTPQGPQPWKYQLEVTTVFPGATPQNSVTSLFFTERLGGTTMFVGTADFDGVVFEASQDLLDTMFILTYAEKNDPGIPSPAADAAATAGSAAPPVAKDTPPAPPVKS